MNVLQLRFSLIFLFVFSLPSFACDICSCGAGASSASNMNSNNSYVGLTYNFLEFRFKDGIHDNAPYGTDYIHQLNINGQYAVNDRLALLLSVPFQNNVRNTEDERVNNNGLGDVNLTTKYIVLLKEQHQIKIGAGIKFPTGKFDFSVASTTNTSALQLGTGSYDFNIPLEYTFKHKRFSNLFKAIYFHKTENDDFFKFGNQTQLQTTANYKLMHKESKSLSINLGASYDLYEESEIRSSKILRTDGDLLSSNIGMRYAQNKMVVGAHSQFPLAQNLVENEVVFQQGLSVYAFYNF